MPLGGSIGRSTLWTAQLCGRPSTRLEQKGDPLAEALGRSQGGFSTKVHVRADGRGKLMTLILTPGQQHEASVFLRLLQQGAVRRVGRSAPPAPKRVIGDKGYTGRRHRAACRRRDIRYTIPHQRRERRTGPFDRRLYRPAASRRESHRPLQAVSLGRHPL
jgi:transposase